VACKTEKKRKPVSEYLLHAVCVVDLPKRMLTVTKGMILPLISFWGIGNDIV